MDNSIRSVFVVGMKREMHVLSLLLLLVAVVGVVVVAVYQSV